ncbi:MAG: efflux RND transporter periplasmic adaptor subunit [Planctomycetes bacterium]|nr:efflux RND transporter periplasmic adaptor subunit [Planctomycetota bacterium]
MHSLVRRAVCLLSLALLPGLATAQQVVIVEPVALQASQPKGRFIGSLRARSTSVMAALEEGALMNLAVREADAVKQGDVLAVVDSRRLEISLSQIQADMAMGRATALEREANLANAVVDLDALERASESGAVSDRDLRNARTQVDVARAMLEAAQQSVASLQARARLLELRIQDATVRAPFDGRIVARHAEVGQWIRPGDPLVTLVSTGALEAWFDVPERHMGGIDMGAESVAIRLEGTGASSTGHNPRIIPFVDDRARTFTLILDVDPAPGLEPGMSASAEVLLGALTPHLVVSKDAVLRRGPNSLVAKVGAENMAELVPVQVLFATEAGFAVEPLMPNGLAEGDSIVVEGNERLFPGTPVTPTTRAQQESPDGPMPPDKGDSPAPIEETDSPAQGTDTPAGE